VNQALGEPGTSRRPRRAECVLFGSIVRELRAEPALSQEALGERADLHRNYVGAIESIEDLWTFSLEPLLAQYLGGLDADTVTAELDRLKAVLLTGTVE
jgi:transcriptional regulator with XRE-family HTH domain